MFLIMVLSCAILVWQAEEPKRQQEQLNQVSNHEAFVSLMGQEAQTIAKQNDLYASVMVAQAILESDWGNSLLSREAYNYYGIKGDYQGQTYTIQTQEDDGTGKLYTIESNFRKYPHYRASMEDYASLMKNGVDWNPDFYAGTWRSKTNSYQDATAYLQGHYATDTSYASKLNALIDQYHLTRFDQ